MQRDNKSVGRKWNSLNTHEKWFRAFVEIFLFCVFLLGLAALGATDIGCQEIVDIDATVLSSGETGLSESQLPLDSTPPQTLQAEQGSTTGGSSSILQGGSEDKKDDTPHYDSGTQSGGGGSCTDDCD